MGLLNKDKAESENLIYQMDTTRLEQREMEKIFARMFSSEDGKKALGYLQMITFHRALGPNSSDVELRHLEGQRAMVASILRLIDRGRNG
nr:hypothetical protein 1 [Alphaproteobacteria bacterium]